MQIYRRFYHLIFDPSLIVSKVLGGCKNEEREEKEFKTDLLNVVLRAVETFFTSVALHAGEKSVGATLKRRPKIEAFPHSSNLERKHL